MRVSAANPLSTIDAIEDAEVLDRVASPLRAGVRALPLGRARELLRGRWQGHPLHPTLVQAPIGSWTSAALLDLTRGNERAARLLIAVGLVTAAPAAVAGATDFADQFPEQERVGVVHAAANTTAIVLYTASLIVRLRGGRGRLLGFAGLAAATAGGFLGGHLTFRQAAGVNHSEAVPHLVDAGWHAVGGPEEFPRGRMVRRMVGEVPVLIVRDAEGTGELHALADRCSHLSGPLSEGEVVDGCVVCPWHGSTFRLADGTCVAGPATAPQPSFEVRLNDGLVEVRLPQAR
ncbi:Rieske (2Fe-2S) protein [Streptomyces sp. SAJ15]|uniref:Rieske 2Fe-2S domain-containing protein n=1 Tax=Streptomyces sp. SAJ15 TaxID=2011095 RepID=UPI001187221A|nr:Rieske (2Fe-2S) protein [Streptomyces sp. SAJ15]TVL91133.1 (2Fe-2S)-binding protein [Streptomyces sp. SAJ15]